MENSYPLFGSPSFSCPHCGAYAQQASERLYRPVHSYFEMTGSAYSPLIRTECDIDFDTVSTGEREALWEEDNNYWNVTVCIVCNEPSFWEGTTLIYPTNKLSSFPQPSPDMPSDVAELYKEANEVFAISRRASAALMRAAAEKLVRILSQDSNLQTGARMNERIAYLSTRTTPAVSQGLNLIRVIGNETLHSDSRNAELVALYLSEDEEGVPQLLAATLNGLVNELITYPRQMDNAYQQLSEGTRERITLDQNNFQDDSGRSSRGS